MIRAVVGVVPRRMYCFLCGSNDIAQAVICAARKHRLIDQFNEALPQD